MGEGSALSCDPSMHGSPRVPSAVRRALALAALVGTAAGGLEAATGPVIVRIARRGGTAPLSAALAEKLPSARVVELTGDLPADTARISRSGSDARVSSAVE
jgi:hypothetical protein